MNSYKNIIAIIDDGVDCTQFEPGQVHFDIEITEQLQVVPRKKSESFQNHGTNCAKIIKNYVPDARFISIKILNKDAKALKDQLIKALEWCIDEDLL